MDKIKILVATHKPADVWQNEVYMPIQVGKAISKFDLGFQGDDTGDNISMKNPYYCELTAQYWGWKNLDCQYIGLCHYRRYFKKQFTPDNIDDEMSDCDIILANPLRLSRSILKFWRCDLIPEDIELFNYFMLNNNCINSSDFNNYFARNNCFYPCNMFVCKKELFNEFASWQFFILQELEKILPFSKYSRENRILGYLGEGLLPFYAHFRKWRIKTMPLVPMIGENKYLLSQTIVKRVINNIRFLLSDKSFIMNEAIKAGLKHDGFIK